MLGVPRGGTTWVARALAATPAATYVHEPDGVHEPFAYRARVRDGLGAQVALRPGEQAREYERLWRGAFAGGRRSVSPRERLAGWVYRGVPAEVRRRARETGKLPMALRVATSCATPLRARNDVSTVVAKSVNAALAGEWLWERFRPEVLVVTRDVRNVVASWLEIGLGPPGEPAFAAMCREAKQRWDVDLPESGGPLERIAAVCSVLLAALHDGLRAHGEWKWLVHEECTRDPSAMLGAVAGSLGLTWTAGARAFVESSNRPGTGYATNRIAHELTDRWKSRLDAGDVAAVTRVCETFPAEVWQVTPRR